jgi:hypothetical protein
MGPDRFIALCRQRNAERASRLPLISYEKTRFTAASFTGDLRYPQLDNLSVGRLIWSAISIIFLAPISD